MTYTLRKACAQFLTNKAQFKYLAHPILEKYYARIEEGHFMGLIRFGTEYWDAYEKKNEVAPTKIKAIGAEGVW